MKMASELIYEQDVVFDVVLESSGSEYMVSVTHTPTGKVLTSRGHKIRDIKAELVQKLEKDLFGDPSRI